MSDRSWVKRSAVSLVLGATFVLSACSSSGGDSTSAPSGGNSAPPGSSVSPAPGGGDSGVAAAQAYLKPFTQKSSDIGITVPLSGKPAPGKTIYTINVQNPLAVEQVDGVQAAAKALGWTVKPLYWTNDPSVANKQILQAVQAKADYIALNGVPDSILKQGIAAAQAANIPIFFLASSTAPAGKANWHFSNVNGVDRFDTAGRISADYLTAKNNAKGDVLMVDIGGYDVQTAQTKGFQAELSKNCPACKYSHISIAITDLASPQKIVAQTVSYLRSHRSINQVVFGAGGMTIGFNAGLKQAGLTGVTVTSINGLTLNLAAILKGEEQATVSEGLPYLGWLAVDAMARYSLGMDLTPNWKTIIPELVQTKDNISGPNDEFKGPTDYEASFKKLWGITA